jgi:hypothetical protein
MMVDVLATMGFFLAFVGIILGSDMLRRVVTQNQTLQSYNERLLALEIELAEQKKSADASMKTMRTLERRAQEARAREVQAQELRSQKDRVEAQLRDFIPSDRKQGAA